MDNERWIFCPFCGVKTRVPGFCRIPSCGILRFSAPNAGRKGIINAQNYQIQLLPDARTQC